MLSRRDSKPGTIRPASAMRLRTRLRGQHGLGAAVLLGLIMLGTPALADVAPPPWLGTKHPNGTIADGSETEKQPKTLPSAGQGCLRQTPRQILWWPLGLVLGLIATAAMRRTLQR